MKETINVKCARCRADIEIKHQFAFVDEYGELTYVGRDLLCDDCILYTDALMNGDI